MRGFSGHSPGISASSENQRPSVRFPHETHMGEFGCLDCHHKYENGENVLEEDALMDIEPDEEIVLDMGASAGEVDGEIKCLACHTDGKRIEGMEAFHDMCMGCHKTSKKGPALCGECHINQ